MISPEHLWPPLRIHAEHECDHEDEGHQGTDERQGVEELGGDEEGWKKDK